MTSDTRQRFQGLCFLQTEGRYSMELYDLGLTENERRRLENSPFNLCTACVLDMHQNHRISVHQAATLMEEMVRQNNDIDDASWIVKPPPAIKIPPSF